MDARKPIVTIMGHVDHGKTQFLDTIRHSTVVEREAGAITQAIGASIIPIETIKRICGKMLEKLNVTLPGLLFIDTPGHAAFSNLRKRGGNLADLAIVIVDANEGMMPQTKESVEILKKYKTPFIVCMNKIDLMPGWRTKEGGLISDIDSQSEDVKLTLDKRLYELVGKLFELGFQSDRFDRVTDYTKQISIIPISAKTGEGIAEVLLSITGLAQKYLNQCLKCDTKSLGKGTILEVKEEKGLGPTMDVILYDGNIKVNDTVVIGRIGEPLVTKVKALLEPKEMCEMRDRKSKFCSVRQALAATGVKITCQEMEGIVAGMPILVADRMNTEKAKREIKLEIEEVLIETDKSGIVIKAESLGSLEAMIALLREKKIPIKKALVGDITRKDTVDALSEKDPLLQVVLGFNVKNQVPEESVKVFINDVIYRLIEEFEKWQNEKKKEMEAKELESVTKPGKIRIMPNYVFRQSNPAICGVEILAGEIKTGTDIMKDGKVVGRIKNIQVDKEDIGKAEAGKQVAMSIEGVTIGRQLLEGDIAYANVREDEFKKLREHKKQLSSDEINILKEFAEIMRKENEFWGI